MRLLVKSAHVAMALGLLLGLAYGIFRVVRFAVGELNALQPEVAAAITAAVATVLVSVATVTASRVFERRQQVEREIRAQKIPIYEEFIGFWFRSLQGEKAGLKAPTNQETMEFMLNFTQNIMMWGSDDVLRKWSHWRRRYGVESGPTTDSSQVLFEFEQLLLAIRRDTGHSNRDLKRGDLLGLFINDINDHL